MDTRYHINVFWSAPDNCWIADPPDLAGCSAHGETAIEAVRELQVAMQLWLESVAEHGDFIPRPRFYPEIQPS
jgi:predicted RNase H-like HicB family nuclease